MNIHKNARLTPRGRERLVKMVLGGQTPAAVPTACGVCPRTVRKWLRRYREEGLPGLADRSSRPKRLRAATPQAIVERIEALRRQRLTGKAIAAELGVSPATVSRVLGRLGLNKLKALEPAEPVRRYERENPGELIHIDIKNWASSTASGTASPASALARARPAASAGSSSMSASTMPRASPSPRSNPTNASKVLVHSSTPPSPIIAAWG